jgi:hypothetical protein
VIAIRASQMRQHPSQLVRNGLIALEFRHLYDSISIATKNLNCMIVGLATTSA